MLRLIIHILSNALGIWAAARLVPGIIFDGDWKWLILAGAVLGFINFFVKPVVKIISLPLIWLTLGLFTIVINVLMLNLAAQDRRSACHRHLDSGFLGGGRHKHYKLFGFISNRR